MMGMLNVFRSIRDIFGYNDTFYHAYVSAQGNWAGYHLGVLTAYFYHRAQTEKWNLRESMVSLSDNRRIRVNNQLVYNGIL